MFTNLAPPAVFTSIPLPIVLAYARPPAKSARYPYPLVHAYLAPPAFYAPAGALSVGALPVDRLSAAIAGVLYGICQLAAELYPRVGPLGTPSS
jgi:hypothetical protein